MPDEIINTPADAPAVAPAPSPSAVEPKGTPAPAAPITKITPEDPTKKNSDAFDDIYKETLAEAEAKEKEASKPDPEPEDEKPEDEKPEDEKPEDEKPEDEKPEDEKPEGDDTPPAPETEATVASQILELMKNPELLQAALKEADVKTIQELPFIKDLVGRSTQSAFDQAKAASEREAFEAQQVTAVLDKGRKAAAEVVDIVDKLRTDLENGAEEFKVPEAEYLVTKFNEYADGAVHAYHNKNFGEIAEVVYNYPEMEGLSPEQQSYLASFNGKPPAQWLDAHFQVQRQNLWTMAQNDVNLKAEQIIKDRTTALEEAHKLDIAKLTERNEKALAKAVEKAKTDTRAEQLTEFAVKGAPPRVPSKEPRQLDSDDIDTGDGSMEAIWAGVKAASAKSAGV